MILYLLTHILGCYAQKIVLHILARILTVSRVSDAWTFSHNVSNVKMSSFAFLSTTIVDIFKQFIENFILDILTFVSKATFVQFGGSVVAFFFFRGFQPLKKFAPFMLWWY
jgi:hypothetical protein